ncbi:MAG TPA: hypothetical protein RMH80_33810 [Polyangiaceae bacterium LLY-WYZ-15_(1-7)]|nr:hypothetical protein [Polyangiaceae bacterium LLY-WYZ-15_(1-7)]
MARRARSWEQLDRDYVAVDEDPAPYVLAFLETTRLVLAEGDALLATGDGARVIGVAAERWDALGAAWARSRGLFDVAPAELHARVRAEPGWAAFHRRALPLARVG